MNLSCSLSFLRILSIFSAGAVVWPGGRAGAQEAAPAPVIVADVIYGHKAGMALTHDIVKPANPNGAAVLFMVSGGWVSIWADPAPLISMAMGARKQNAFGMLLDHGFTLYLVRHGSSPYFKVPDAVSDVRRAVRHVRLNAPAQGVDPDRLGVFGGSAGGHLALMLGTTGDAGNPASADPVEKVSNRVAAVTAFYPPTDLKGYINDKRFPALHFPEDQADSVSPLKHVSPDDAPSLLVVGSKDTLVVPAHSENILAAFQKDKVPAELLVFPDAAHGFAGEDEKKASVTLTAWFEKYLTGAKTPAPDKAAAAPVTGVWDAKAALPDGGNRPGKLTLREEDGKLVALSENGEGERRIDRVTWADNKLTLELDFERDGHTGLIKVNATSPAPGELKGTWAAVDASGTTVISGDWEARKKTEAAKAP